MAIKTALTLVLMLTCPAMAFGRIRPTWTYQEIHGQADLVVIAKPISSANTSERTVFSSISPNVKVVGVQTEFAVRVVMEGEATIQKFTLHHYRLANAEDGRVRGATNLVSFDAKRPECYLLFLKKEADGLFAPITGHIDPGDDSVIKLQSSAQ